MKSENIRNVAIIAHVDHGKTTLVDGLLKQSNTFRENQAEMSQTLLMDSGDQESERGITITAKQTSIYYGDYKINIIDTPGHADFSGEVERTLNMADGVILVVDAQEGPMPQTKFVLSKALELGLKPIVVVNKIDKPAARPDRVIDQLFDLFILLGASDEQADFPIIYASAKNGYAMKNLTDEAKDLTPLFDAILENVAPAAEKSDLPFCMQVANLGYDDYLGRLGVGRVYQGTLNAGSQVTIIGNDGEKRTGKIAHIFRTLGLQRIEIPQAEC